MAMKRSCVLNLSIVLFMASVGAGQTLERGTSPRKPSLRISVWDDNYRFLRDLGKENFEVRIDGKTIEIAEVSRRIEPLSIGIVFDSDSRAYDGPEWQSNYLSVVQGLRAFVARLKDGDEYFLINRGREIEVGVDNTSDTAKALKYLDARSATDLQNAGDLFFDAFKMGFEKAVKMRHSDRILLVVSRTGISDVRFDEVRKMVRGHNVQLYFVKLVSQPDASKPPFVGRSLGNEFRMDQLVSESGGILLEADTPRAISKAFDIITEELKSQYYLTVDVPPDKPGKWAKVKVSIIGSEKKAARNMKSPSGIAL